ncbi:MAG: arabinan endo-1,5-alpha-L-arabinosidase [Phycisphaerales bacterium]|nr:MAG: arabinan endo-1,5-alpha-L-arabinosidase [Phycisphaerales bacterium]
MSSAACTGGIILCVCLAMALSGCSAEQGTAPADIAEQKVEADVRTERPRDRSSFVHDPSTIVKCKDEYWLFSTGRGVRSRRSKDLLTWQSGPQVFLSPPAWAAEAVPGNRGYFWAPDVIGLQNRFLLYYSVSRWGVNTSAIALATTLTLDPDDPDYGWTDLGIVIRSDEGDDFNAIDPAVTQDAKGNLWLAFGSFWSGIKLIQLDPSTGKRISPDSPIYSLAYHDSIEAPFIFSHGGYHYLFVNWGLCCRRTNSTYNIRIGRSAEITGPYLDKNGADMLEGGGSLFLETKGQSIGPGHAGIISEGDTDWLSYHYYDGNRRGSATLALRRLRWNADGWPEILEPPDSN